MSEEFRAGGLDRAKKPVLSALPPGLESLALVARQGGDGSRPNPPTEEMAYYQSLLFS